MDRLVTKKELALFIVFSWMFYFLFTYKSFNNYFYYDDLDTLSWIHVFPIKKFIVDMFDFNLFKMESFYRPFGSLIHSICFKLFGLNFLPYHIILTLLHLFNLVCVSVLIAKLVPSRFGVITGAFLFTFHLTALPIYWYFFGIFDSLSAAFMLLSLLFYIKDSGKFNVWYLLSVFCFVLALRSKEMPLSFPLILIAYEILIVPKSGSKIPSFRQIIRGLWPFLVISLSAGLLKLSASIKVDKSLDYSLHFDLLSLLGGFHHFVTSALYEMRLPLYVTLILLAVLGIVPILLKSRTLAFAYLFTIISLFPILPLANRRADYHMYIPLIGVSIYAAELFHCLQRVIARNGGRFLPQLYVVITVLLIFHFQRNWELKRIIEDRYILYANENREFVQLLAPHHAGPSAIYLYDSAPLSLRFRGGVFAVVNLLFHDWNVTTESIPDCATYNPPATDKDICCVSFRNRTVRIWPADIRKQ